jgi:hypothetical protein
MQVNYDFYENLTPQKVDELVGELKKDGLPGSGSYSWSLGSGRDH